MTLARYQELLAECGTELEVRRLVLDFTAARPETDPEVSEAVRQADAWVAGIGSDQWRVTSDQRELRHELHEFSRMI